MNLGGGGSSSNGHITSSPVYSKPDFYLCDILQMSSRNQCNSKSTTEHVSYPAFYSDHRFVYNSFSSSLLEHAAHYRNSVQSLLHTVISIKGESGKEEAERFQTEAKLRLQDICPDTYTVSRKKVDP